MQKRPDNQNVERKMATALLFTDKGASEQQEKIQHQTDLLLYKPPPLAFLLGGGNHRMASQWGPAGYQPLHGPLHAADSP